MGEETEKSPVSGTPELSPQEDGTKVPLANNEDAEPKTVVEEVKYTKGDCNIDIGSTPVFTGLTKDELMKYSADPFWIRLRMFLFILFWLTWLAMLIIAIVIIVQAPGCKPPPEILWVEEQAMVNIDRANMPTADELSDKMNMLGIDSAYFPDLISRVNLSETNYHAIGLIDAVVMDSKRAVTDFPSSIGINNPWYKTALQEDYIHIDGTWNYENTNLTDAILDGFLNLWIAKGVTGFLMESTDSEEAEKFKEDLNGKLKEKGAAIGSNVVDFEPQKALFTPEKFRAFLEDSIGNWSFYKFDPTTKAARSLMTEDELRLVTMGLFLYSGTPILTNYRDVDNSTALLIKHLSEMRKVDGIKIGITNVANTTKNVVAYTRAYKGTPAYAIALNFNNANETVSFEGTPNIGSTGTVEIDSTMEQNKYEAREKCELTDIFLRPFEGLVIQFVANF